MGYKHGMKGTRIYGIWQAMKRRCENKNTSRYFDYGGRGISVCEEWHDFKKFHEWAINNGYSDNLTIDRIDNNGNYEPSNCRCVTLEEQANNSRHCHYISFNGETHSIAEWARITGIKRHVINNRINNYGWTIERALTVPARKKSQLFKEGE